MWLVLIVESIDLDSSKTHTYTHTYPVEMVSTSLPSFSTRKDSELALVLLGRYATDAVDLASKAVLSVGS